METETKKIMRKKERRDDIGVNVVLAIFNCCDGLVVRSGGTKSVGVE